MWLFTLQRTSALHMNQTSSRALKKCRKLYKAKRRFNCPTGWKTWMKKKLEFWKLTCSCWGASLPKNSIIIYIDFHLWATWLFSLKLPCWKKYDFVFTLDLLNHCSIAIKKMHSYMLACFHSCWWLIRLINSTVITTYQSIFTFSTH